MESISHWINGSVSTEKSERTGDVYNPATGGISAKVNFATNQTVDKANSGFICVSRISSTKQGKVSCANYQ